MGTRESDPIARLRAWYERAVASGEQRPDAMALATVGPGGAPSLRIVLVKRIGDDGIVFYTDRRSRKGRELSRNPLVAATFHWPGLRRQVRIEGEVERVSDEEADAYWATRPRGSRLSGAVSHQSRPLSSRAALVARRADLARRLAGKPVPRPAAWGGYRIVPERIEFWTHRANRLHHRELFRRGPRGGWRVVLLEP